MNMYLVTNDEGVSNETHSLEPTMSDLRALVEKHVRGNNSGVLVTVGTMENGREVVQVVGEYTIQDAGEEVDEDHENIL